MGESTSSLVQVSPVDGATLLFVPAGVFTMGNPSSDPQAYTEEIPDHLVNLDIYWIDQTEVTNAQFSRFVEETGYQTDAERRGWAYLYNTAQDNFQESSGADWRHPFGPSSSIDGLANHPVLQVSWFDAVAYCEWAGRRLPTEAEWEKAARGAGGQRFPWGNDEPTGLHLNLADQRLGSAGSDETIDDGYAHTAPVGSYPGGASPYGALDMAGNAWEWVQDWYSESYYADSSADNPMGPDNGEFRVLRGGGWNRPARFSRTANRGWGYPDMPNNLIGFRCAAGRE
jgi:serine/threonine-protein kinase